MSQGLPGVRQAARERKQERFTALLHHLSVGLLRDSFYALERQASSRIDGVTWQEYETGLEDRLVDLHSRVHRGAYQARPSRRVYIPKADGRQHPLGVAALEDKIVQQAAVAILKPETFTLLGFTHFCGQRKTNGAFTVWRITPNKRMVAKLKAIKAEFQRCKHHRTTEVGGWLRKVVLGYYRYHAVPGNSNQLRIFSRRVC